MQTSEGTGFVISVQADWACAWIRPEGDLDAQTAPLLLQALDQALEQGVRKVHLWLNEVPFMDSAGIQMLAGVDERARSRRSKLILHSPHPAVRQLLDRTRGSETLIIK
jgi:anti-anti-sigma factor